MSGFATARTLTLHIIDPDPAVREGLQSLLRTLNVEVETYPSAEAFLAQPIPSNPGCLISEVHLPGMTGIELLQRLYRQGRNLPAILLSYHGDIPTAVHAMQTGAVDFLEKPFVDKVLLSRVRKIMKSLQ